MHDSHFWTKVSPHFLLCVSPKRYLSEEFQNLLTSEHIRPDTKITFSLTLLKVKFLLGKSDIYLKRSAEFSKKSQCYTYQLFSLGIRKITASKYDPTKTQEFSKICRDVLKTIGFFETVRKRASRKVPATSHSCHSCLQEICFLTRNCFYPFFVSREVYLSFRVSHTITSTKAVYLFVRRGEK